MRDQDLQGLKIADLRFCEEICHVTCVMLCPAVCRPCPVLSLVVATPIEMYTSNTSAAPHHECAPFTVIRVARPLNYGLRFNAPSDPHFITLFQNKLFEEDMSFAQAIRLVVLCAIGLFWSTGVLLRCLQLLVTKPTEFLARKDRKVRPKCLDNPDFGSHHFTRSKVRGAEGFVCPPPQWREAKSW